MSFLFRDAYYSVYKLTVMTPVTYFEIVKTQKSTCGEKEKERRREGCLGGSMD